MYKVALAQMRSVPNLGENLQTSMRMIEEARTQKAQAILFPEASLFIGRENADYKGLPEPLDGPLMKNFKEVAKLLKMEIFLGGFLEQSPNPLLFFNSAVWIGNDGEIKAVYRKIHLFDLAEMGLKESNQCMPGQELVTLEHPMGKLGFSICYDLRFPNQFQKLRDLGAKVLLIPAAFTKTTGEAHWLALMRARAIETQCYVLAPAQWGAHHEKRSSFGSTLVIDPWGQVVAIQEEGEGLIYAEIDPNLPDQVRRRMPVFEHRVPFVDGN